MTGRSTDPDAQLSFGKRLGIGLGLGIWFVIAYAGVNRLVGWRGVDFNTSTRFDAVVPFWPSTAVFYLSLLPAMWLPVILLTNRTVFLAHAASLASALLLAAAIFVAFPVLPPPFAAPEDDPLFAFADWVNLDYCGLPSLHVTFALWIFLVCAPLLPRPGAVALGLWAGLSILSTMTTRQHTLADALAGLALALVAVFLFYPVFPKRQAGRR